MYLVWDACNPVTYRKVREVGLGSHAQPAYTERKFSDKNGQRRYSNLDPDICGRRPTLYWKKIPFLTLLITSL